MADASSGRNLIGKALSGDRSDILVSVGVIAIVMMMLVPLPAVFLDILMAFNLVFSLIIILMVLYAERPLDFSLFPTILLISTVFSLALNVSSTRLILSKGDEFDGRMVRAFSTFVVGTEGGSGLVIGFIIFLIIIAVQFIVITKGATRVAEVAARFTLDAMPQKQYAVESEYNAGAISEEEMRTKKREIQKESDFYGAMDGASKFVSGNVKVGLLITAINAIGGIIVGMTIHGATIGMAASTYVALTVGDGLVTQFPALMVSTATGLLVTRSVSDGSFGKEAAQQFSLQARVYWVGAGFLFAIGLIPGFPWYVLLPMSGVMAFTAYRLGLRQRRAAEATRQAEEQTEEPEGPAEIPAVVPVDPIALEVGFGLIPLVDRDKGAELLDRITRIRRETALDLGIVVPKVRIIDNMRLEPSEYCIKIKGVEVGKSQLRIGMYMAINPGQVSEELQGERAVDPAFGLPALWVSEKDRDRAERAGYMVVDSPSIIATHMTEIIKSHAGELIGRQEIKNILDTLAEDYSAVVEEVRGGYKLGDIQKVLQGLLLEQVSIRNMVPILETLADYAGVGGDGRGKADTAFLVEKVRQALGRQICLQYMDDDHILRVISVEPALEEQILESRVDTPEGPMAAMEPDMQRKWINGVVNAVREVQEQGFQPVILSMEQTRRLIKESLRRELPQVAVLSLPEIVKDLQVEFIARIQINEE